MACFSLSETSNGQFWGQRLRQHLRPSVKTRALDAHSGAWPKTDVRWSISCQSGRNECKWERWWEQNLKNWITTVIQPIGSNPISPTSLSQEVSEHRMFWGFFRFSTIHGELSWALFFCVEVRWGVVKVVVNQKESQFAQTRLRSNRRWVTWLTDSTYKTTLLYIGRWGFIFSLFSSRRGTKFAGGWDTTWNGFRRVSILSRIVSW